MNIETIINAIELSSPHVTVKRNIKFDHGYNTNWLIIQNCEIKAKILFVNASEMETLVAIEGYFYYNSSENLFKVKPMNITPNIFIECNDESLYSCLENISFGTPLVHKLCKNELDLLYHFYFDLWKKHYNEFDEPTNLESLKVWLEIQRLTIPCNKSFDPPALKWQENLSIGKYNIKDITEIPFFIRKESFKQTAYLGDRQLGTINTPGIILRNELSSTDLEKFSLEPHEIHMDNSEYAYIFKDESEFKEEHDFDKTVEMSLLVKKDFNSDHPDRIILDIQLKDGFKKYIDYKYVAYPHFQFNETRFFELKKNLEDVRKANDI